MEVLLEKLLSMSVSAGWLILAVLLLRLVFCRAPKWSRCILWALVGLRLVLVISPESPLSLIPQGQTITQFASGEKVFGFTGGMAFIAEQEAALQGQAVYNAPEAAAAEPEWMTVLAWIWLIGVILLLGYALVSILRLRRRVAEAAPIEGNVWQCDHLDSPFILGVLRPKIYLPSDLPQTAIPPVLAHERAHLARKDHWWKPLGFVLLVVYWFHPLVWLAYCLFCRDLELACDERAVRKLDAVGRRAYSLALLTCSVDRRGLAACPLAFGEGSVKGRIKAVLNDRRPAFWLAAAAVAACIAAAVCFLTDPVRDPSLEWVRNLTADQVASIDLVVMPQSQDKQYRQFSPEEIPAVVALLSQSGGKPVSDPEALEGQSIWFYLMLTDGTRHEVGNIGNVYLVIDGSWYSSPYRWLSAWSESYGAGDSPLPEGYFDRTLTLEDVRTLSVKGNNLTWSDLDDFTYTEIGSGLYIRLYPMAGPYTMHVGGAGPSGGILYANLLCSYFGEGVDIRTGDVEAFLQDQQARWSRSAELFAAAAASPAAASGPGDYLDAHPEEHQALLAGGRDTLCYIFTQFLAGGQTGLEGHLMRLVLDELAPEAQLKLAADTGQEYFDAWREAADGVLAEHGVEWMEENQPAMWLMLQMGQAGL